MQEIVASEQRVINDKSYKVLVKDCYEVVDGKDFDHEQIFLVPDENGKLENVRISYIENVLNVNVFGIWDVKDCQTDLKRKLYKETTEYKQRYQTLKEDRTNCLATKFYYLIKLPKDYDVTHKGFPLVLDDYEDAMPNMPAYLIKKCLCFDYATSRFPKHKITKSRYYGGSDYFVKQKIYLSVPNEQDALKIEDVGSNKALLIIFKLDSAFKANPSGLWERTYLKTKIQSLYIVNTKTEEVLYKVY